MGVAQYVIGVALAAVSIGAIVAGARALRRRVAPELQGPVAPVATAVLTVAEIVVALELVGVLGWLHRVGAAAGCVVVGGTAWWLARRGRPIPAAGAEAATPGRRRPALAEAATLIAVVVIAAPWLGWTLYAYGHGMETVDTLWYHLPFAARFVQLGSVLHLQYFDPDPVTVFYPANSELVHALGLALFHDDFLSPLVNLGWAALALASAWAIGRPSGRGPHATLGVTLVLATPGMVDSQPGGAYNDVVCIALLLAAAALLVNGHERAPGGVIWRPAAALAAVAAGLALGTKFTMIVPAIALGVGAVAITVRGDRRRQALIWVGGLVLLGGYWYLRNWIVAGNPVPSVAIHLGPLSLPAPYVPTPIFTVAQYLLQGHIYTSFFFPGLRESLGFAWWALMLGGAAGALAALLVGGDRVIRLLGAIAAISAVAFVFTPQFLGLPGIPLFFVDNVRYSETALALGLALLPVGAGRGRARTLAAGVVVAMLALVATELDPAVWPTGIGVKAFQPALHGAAAIVGALLAVALGAATAGWRWAPRSTRLTRAAPRPAGPRWPAWVAGAGGLVIVVAAGLIGNAYTGHRYRSTYPLPRIYAWAQHVHRARIGIAGFELQYPLAGPDGSNYVQYIGRPAPHAGFAVIATCPAWRRAVNAGRYGWLVVTPAGFPFGTARSRAPEAAWLTGQPVHLTLLERGLEGAPAALYRVEGRLDPGTCPA